MLLITNGTLITWEQPNRILEGHALYLANGKIGEIGPQQELLQRYPEANKLDAGGQYVMPGNICAHTHFYGAFARGMAIPGPAPKDFPEILQKLWWPLDKSLDKEAVRLSAEVMLAEAIRHGTTTLIDHHASPNAIEGSLDTIAGVVDRSGLRAVLCYEVTDRDGSEKAYSGIQENVRFIQKVSKERPAQGRLGATFGLHASLTLSNQTLEACRDAAPPGTGFHIHVAEHEADEYDSQAKAGTRVVDRLTHHQILGPQTIVAHAVHVDARETDLLAQSRTWVSHQPRSNMNNGVGAAPLESLARAGVNLCLGTDGFSHTMWEEAKFAYLLQKVWHRDPRRLPGDEVYHMAVHNNAALASRFFPEAQLGVLAPGAWADIIFVDYHPNTPLTSSNLPWHMLFGFHESMLTTTIVSGEVLMQDRQLVTLDEEQITAHAREKAPQVWESYQSYVPR